VLELDAVDMLSSVGKAESWFEEVLETVLEALILELGGRVVTGSADILSMIRIRRTSLWTATRCRTSSG